MMGRHKTGPLEMSSIEKLPHWDIDRQMVDTFFLNRKRHFAAKNHIFCVSYKEMVIDGLLLLDRSPLKYHNSPKTQQAYMIRTPLENHRNELSINLWIQMLPKKESLFIFDG